MEIKKGTPLTRREFLKDAGIIAGGVTLGSIGLLSACSPGQTVTDTITSTATVTSSVTTTATPTTAPTTTTTAIPTSTVSPNFPLSVKTNYVYGGMVDQIYDAVPSKPKSLLVTEDISQFLVHFNKHDLIYSVWGSYKPNTTMTPEEDKILQSLNYVDQGFPSTEYLLNSISNGANLVVTSNPSFIRESIFTRDMAGFNQLGCKYFYSFGVYFNGGEKYSKINLKKDPSTGSLGDTDVKLNDDGTTTYSWDHFFATTRALGVLFDIVDEAEEYINGQMAIVNYIKGKGATSSKPTVMFIYHGGGNLYGSYDNGLMQLMCEDAGCTYLHGSWTNETVLEMDPDIIIDRVGPVGTVPIKDDPMFADLKSVKNGTCYADYTLPWTSNSASLLVGSQAATVANYIHPEWRTG